MSLCQLPLVVGCLLLASGETPLGDGDERERLEGTWSFIQSADSTKQKKAAGPAVQVVFQGETIRFVPEGNKRVTKGTYTIDPGKSPKTMDILVETGSGKVLTQAIYQLDGDQLVLCHYLGKLASQERPKEFLADKQTVVGRLKREKQDR